MMVVAVDKELKKSLNSACKNKKTSKFGRYTYHFFMEYHGISTTERAKDHIQKCGFSSIITETGQRNQARYKLWIRKQG